MGTLHADGRTALALHDERRIAAHVAAQPPHRRAPPILDHLQDNEARCGREPLAAPQSHLGTPSKITMSANRSRSSDGALSPRASVPSSFLTGFEVEDRCTTSIQREI